MTREELTALERLRDLWCEAINTGDEEEIREAGDEYATALRNSSILSLARKGMEAEERIRKLEGVAGAFACGCGNGPCDIGNNNSCWHRRAAKVLETSSPISPQADTERT